MSTITMTGLASGIDVQGMLDKLVAVGQQPITDVNKQKAQVDSAASTVSSLASKLATLKNAALALSTPTGFSSFSASSSDTSVVSTVSGAAVSGSYTVSVTSLASAQKSRSTAFASSTTKMGTSGSLDIQVGSGTKFNVAISDTDTLADVAAKITASGARVSATVVNAGSESRLVVQGLDSGAANAITFTENGVSLGLTSYQPAQDASLTVDGLPITSATNQITGVIPGVKLALTKPTTSPATVQVTADGAAVRQKIQAFVSAYNDFVNTGHNAAGYGSTKAANSVLAADGSIRAALHKLGSLSSSAVQGATGSYTTLASVGIVLQKDGTLTFDSTKLDDALAKDASSVSRLFVTDTTTGATGIMKTIMTAVDDLTSKPTSVLTARQAALAQQSKRLADRAQKMQDRLDDYTTQLQKKFNAMDQAVGKYQAMAAQVANITNNNGTG